MRILKWVLGVSGFAYLLLGGFWATACGFRTNKLLDEHGKRNRYDKVTRAVGASRNEYGDIVVCVEGERLEVQDEDVFSIRLPTNKITILLNSSQDEPFTFQEVTLARDFVSQDCLGSEGQKIPIPTFTLGSVGSLQADEKLNALRPPPDSASALYEIKASWDGGATISEKRRLAWVVDQPRLNGRHYVVIKTEPVFGEGPEGDRLRLLGAWTKDVLTFPRQVYGLYEYLGSH